MTSFQKKALAGERETSNVVAVTFEKAKTWISKPTVLVRSQRNLLDLHHDVAEVVIPILNRDMLDWEKGSSIELKIPAEKVPRLVNSDRLISGDDLIHYWGVEGKIHRNAIQKPTSPAAQSSVGHLLEDLQLPALPTAASEKVVIALDVALREAIALQERTREQLQAQLQALGEVRPESVGEGRQIANLVNEMLARFGFKFRFLNSEGCYATLLYTFENRTKKPYFVLSGRGPTGKRTTESILHDFTRLEVVFAPLDGRRARFAQRSVESSD